MGNLPTHPHRTRCPDRVPWCINPLHPGPAPAHLADVETIDLGAASVGIILYRPVTETHPAATLVRIHYGPDAEHPAWLDLPPAVAAALGQILTLLTVRASGDFARALTRGAALVQGEVRR